MGGDAAMGWGGGPSGGGQERETGDETAAADILYTLLQGTWMLFLCAAQRAHIRQHLDFLIQKNKSFSLMMVIKTKALTISSSCEYRDECGSQETIVGRETKLFVTKGEWDKIAEHSDTSKQVPICYFSGKVLTYQTIGQ